MDAGPRRPVVSDSTMARVSVVITARNAGPHLAQTLDSILAQSYRDFEIIVVDGGSTDGTIDVARAYPPPVRVISGRSLTKSAGRNVGIQASTGEFVALVDADDWWVEAKLARQLEYLEQNPWCQWVYSDCYLFDDRAGRISG